MPEPWEAEWRDYYALLECAQSASLREIRSSFRRLARTYHPDVSHSDGTHFKLIAEAYETLSDPKRRLAYDRAYVRVKHGFAPQMEIMVEPSELVVRARARRVTGFAVLHGISPEAGVPLDVSVRDPDVELRHVAAQWMRDSAKLALIVRWEAELIGRARRFEVIYAAAGLAAVQHVDAHAPRFALHETVATPAGRRTYVFGLHWLDLSREHVIVIPGVAALAVVFGALFLGEHDHHTLARVVAWAGGLLTAALSLVFLNAFLATNSAWVKLRRFVPIAGGIVLVVVVEELVRAFH